MIMGKKRLSHDQKRKAKLAERARKNAPTEDLVYKGNRYKTDELIPVVHATETGIFLAYLRSGQQIVDAHVRQALERMVILMRGQDLPEFDRTAPRTYQPGEETELIMQCIRARWHSLFERHPHPGTETLIGILRTLLGSIETWSVPSPTSRGYLNFLEGFLKRAGVAIGEEDQELFKEFVEQEKKEELEDPLLDLGQEWLAGNPDVRASFFQEAQRQIDAGQGQHVAEVTERLIGLAAGGPHFKELSRLAITAQNSIRPQLP
jgi:hypothetical protein